MDAPHRTVIVDDVVDRVSAECGMAAAGLYQMLERRVNRDGTWTSSIAALAAMFRQSERHVRDAASRLEERGFVRRETVTGPNGMATGIRFHLPFHLRTNRAEATPEPTPEVTPEPSCALEEESSSHVVVTSNESLSAARDDSASDPTDDDVGRAADGNAARSAPGRAAPSGSAALRELSAAFERRDAVFAAYAAVFGIKRDAGEWFTRWNLGSGHLSEAVLAELTPERMTAIATFCRDRRAAAGLTHTPDLDLVLRDESNYDRWVARGSPPHEAKDSPAVRRPSSAPPTMQRGSVGDGGLAAYRRRQQQGAKQ